MERNYEKENEQIKALKICKSLKFKKLIDLEKEMIKTNSQRTTDEQIKLLREIETIENEIVSIALYGTI